MKARRVIALCSLLSLYGCSGAATQNQTQHRTDTDHHHKISAAYIPVRVSIYEFSSPVTPELKELLQQPGAKVSFRPVSPSLEDELSELTTKGKVKLIQDMSGVTTNNEALPFSVSNYTVQQQPTNGMKEERNVMDDISVVITPALSADSALMQMTVDISLTAGDKKKNLPVTLLTSCNY
ncbi:hypothetical protein UXO11_22740 [Enterobacter wuhouensis]|uniref:hypothetical protein n=1 Tax=Enterobacter wuhouensis TaxID=2529381 RepID=UPI002FD4B90A